MKKLLEKFKMLETFDCELKIQKETFVYEFEKITSKGYYSPLLIILDIISNSKKHYVGDIKPNSFKIRENYNIDKLLSNFFTIAKAEFEQENNTLNIKTLIQGMGSLQLVIRLVVFFIYLLTILLLIIESFLIAISDDKIEMNYYLPPIIITLFIYFLCVHPYIMARNGIKEMKNDLEIKYRLIEKLNNVKIL
ncbi:hypothetical protein [Wenyingzhuangia sp. IMCC45574]